MDCETFDSALLDALYEELDAAVSDALAEHVATCPECASRLESFRKLREVVRPALELPAPATLEDRILALSAEMPAAAPSKLIAIAEGRSETRTERRGVIAFLSRPQFAVAAAVLLAVSAALFMSTSRKEAATASSVAASKPAPGAFAKEPATTATASPPSAASALAFATAAPEDLSGQSERNALAPAARAGAPHAGPATKTADSSFDSAKALFDAGRCDEALPRFEALAPSNPDAELYAARCFAQRGNCAAAIPRFDNAANRNAGNENGSRAALEAARCVKQTGQVTAARSRYRPLTNDGFVANEARSELDALEAPRAAAKAAAPPPPPAPPKAAPPAEQQIIKTTK